LIIIYIIISKSIKRGKIMEKTKIDVNERIRNTYRIIHFLMTLPEDKRAIVMAVASAYMDGIEAGKKMIAERD
jgi:hypothetical protein